MEPDVDPQFGPTLRCALGDMILSHWMYEELSALVAGTPRQDSKKRGKRWGVGGKWFCPRDKEVLVESNGAVMCPVCGLDLTTAVYALIELHTHKARPGSSFPYL
jgi:hypothetical protein